MESYFITSNITEEALLVPNIEPVGCNGGLITLFITAWGADKSLCRPDGNVPFFALAGLLI